MNKQIIFLAFTVLFFCTKNFAQTNAQSFIPKKEIDSTIIHAMEAAIENQTYPNIHSVLISLNNKIIYEKYWAGNDVKDGINLGVIAHGQDSTHALKSMTKSVVSACIGIALQQGKIKSINQNIFDFFPEFKLQDTGLKANITIKDLLTMTAGLQWNEENYNRPENSANQFDLAPDPVAYIMQQPMSDIPGKAFNYNGGASQLLAGIVEKSSGEPIDVFATKYLFAPLGISNFKWNSTDGSDVKEGDGGLYMTPDDMMKFGLLYMNDGKYESKQIISASWVKESTAPFILADDGSDSRYNKSEYGFQWWIFKDTIAHKPILLTACVGNGDQRIFVDKADKMVVVFTGGNYNMPDRYLNPYTMLKKFIYPALFK